MLQLGFNEATCKENSCVSQDIRLCSKFGYQAIELRLDMLKEYFKKHTIEELKDLLEGNHLQPFALNSIEDINFCSDEAWEELLELFTFACETAQAINNPYIVVVPTMTAEYQTRSEKEVTADSVKVLNQLADIAEPYGVKLAFEPIGDRRWCCNSLRHAIEIIKKVDRDSVGLVVDCINFYMHDKCSDLASIGKIPPGKLFVFHLNDCEDLPFGELDHCHRIMPGHGCIPIAEISRAVQDAGYNGPACLELFRPEYWEMEAEEVIELGAICSAPYLK